MTWSHMTAHIFSSARRWLQTTERSDGRTRIECVDSESEEAFALFFFVLIRLWYRKWIEKAEQKKSETDAQNAPF